MSMDKMADLASDETAILENHVRSQVGRRVQSLKIVQRNSGVVLRGEARSFYVKQLAQHALMQVSRVPILANEIAVI